MSKLEQCQMLENHFNEQESDIARAALGASLSRCHFQENRALKQKNSGNKNNHFYGGSTIFLTCKNSLVINCSFLHNLGGGSVKIFNKFENEIQKRIQLEENKNKISIL